MRIEINRPATTGMARQYVASDATYIYDDLRTSGIRVFQTVCTLDEQTVDAMLNNGSGNKQEIANKSYVALWIEDLGNLELFGLYRHDDRTYLVKADLEDLKRVINEGSFWVSDFLKRLIMK